MVIFSLEEAEEKLKEIFKKIDKFKEEVPDTAKEELKVFKTNITFLIFDAGNCDYERLISYTDPYIRTKRRLADIIGTPKMWEFETKIDFEFRKLLAETLKKECSCK